ncbi:MAG: hypothetical protein WA160_16395 [Pseudobdellovibrio sp.]
MRIILITIGSLLISFIIFWTIKFWGRGHSYVDYQHPFYSTSVMLDQPVIFIKPSVLNIENALMTESNLYLDVSSTEDGRLVLKKKEWSSKEKPVRYAKYDEIKNDVILISDLKEKLANKKIIFNLVENAQAGHIIFYEEIKKAGLEKGDNFVVTSPYEAMGRSLKDIAPRFLFGSTQPEILKLVAMKSMGLIEAVNLRADVIIFPLMIRNQKFYDDELIQEMNRRHKRILIGPINEKDMKEAKSLKPFGIIINK